MTKRQTTDAFLATVSQSTRAANARQGAAVPVGAGVERLRASLAVQGPKAPPMGKDCRSVKGRRKPPSPATKAEAEWVAYLHRVFVGAIIRAHGLTLVFPDGDRYSPDAVMWHEGHLTIYEVKAGYRGPGWEQGTERYKRAKAEWYWLDFRLAEKRRDGWHLDGKPCNVALSGPPPAGQ